ncbi:MAG: galactonate dehydratase [Chloroflexota bacterium]
MKITDVKTFKMQGGRRNWLFVKIETDEGIHGWGEATLERHEQAVEGGIRWLANILEGRDPTRVEQNWQLMYRHGFWRGGVVMGSAMSGIDHALWDITGKAYGQPVYKLLGGAVRDRIRAYGHWTDIRDGREAMDPMKFSAYKTGGWETGKSSFYEKDMPEELREKIRGMREELGPDVDIMIDNHGRARPSVAIKQIEAVQEFDILFFEEAVPPDNLDAFQQVRDAGLRTDLATGERLFFRWGFRDLLHRRLVDVVQPDICHAGGISELRRIAAMAEMEHIKFAPHNPQGPISTAASVQLCAAAPNFLILETARDMPWHDRVQRDPLVIEDGYFQLPTAPGLGVDLDEDVIASRPYTEPEYGAGAWDAHDNTPLDV